MDLISFGSTFLELVFGPLDALPAAGEELFTEDFAVSCGGAVTVLDAAAQAGLRTGICTRLGTDLASRVVERHCERRGIDLSPAIRVEEPAGGITVVFNFAGDRAFVTHLPTPTSEPVERERWKEVLKTGRPRWCYLHAGRGVVPVLEAAREVGTKVALDVNFGPIDELPDVVADCVRLADVFVPNEAELLRLAGTCELEAAIAAVAAWCPLLVVKRGPAGAVAVEGGRAQVVSEGIRDVEVRDRTGAGDAFAGALIAALVRGAGAREAAAAGNAAGSAAVSRFGAVGEVEGDVLYTREVKRR